MKKLTLKFLLSFVTIGLLSSAFNITNAGGDGCAAGGPGATSCEYSVTVGPITTTTSVSCGEGYYACCNPTGASCKKNAGGSGEESDN